MAQLFRNREKNGPRPFLPPLKRLFRLRYAGLVLIGCLVFLPAPGNAQIGLQTSKPANLATFRQVLDVYDWHYVFGWGGVRRSLMYALGVDFATSMQRRPSDDKWKENQTVFWRLRQQVSAKTAILGDIKYTNFNDELSSFNYDRQMLALTFANPWRPTATMKIQPELGFRWEKRANLTEKGPFVGLAVNAPVLRIAEYKGSFIGQGEMTLFPARRNGNAHLAYTIWREFQPGTRDSLLIYADYARRDNFFSDPRTGRIESLRRLQRGFDNFLVYQMSPQAALVMRSTLAFAKVSVFRLDTGVTTAKRAHDDFTFEHRMEMKWQSNRLDNIFIVEMAQREIKYDIPDSSGFLPFSPRFSSLGYDIEDKKALLANRTTYRKGINDLFRLYLEVSKTQHDNSDRQYPDSYDEQRWHFYLSHEHRFNRFMTFQWRVNAFLKHFIYTDASLSSQNNWTRWLGLQPSVQIRPAPGWILQQKFGVRAQYVDFDFDEMLPVRSSYVIRNFYLADSIVIPLGHRLQMKLDYRYEFEELGGLNWRKFTTQPRTQWNKHWLSLVFGESTTWGLQYNVGVLFYQQTRSQFQSLDAGRYAFRKEGVHSNLGPTLQVLYQGKNGSLIIFRGDRQKVFPFLGNSYYINNLELTVQWTF